jgi:hypothetical protein
MGIWETVLTVLIIGGAIFLLYRSLWKKRGYCPGCSNAKCGIRISGGSDDGSKKYCNAVHKAFDR